MALLLQKQAMVSYHDPYVASVKLNGGTLTSIPLTPQALAEADCVVLITDHTVFDWNLIAGQARLIVDSRNALGGVSTGQARVVKL